MNPPGLKRKASKWCENGASIGVDFMKLVLLFEIGAAILDHLI